MRQAIAPAGEARPDWAIIAAVTPSYAGVSHSRLERGEALHWPVPDAAHPGTPILHAGWFPRSRGRFFPCEHPAAELPDRDYPLYLTTGRVLYYWHGGKMMRRVSGLLEVYPRALVEISPEDAAQSSAPGQRPRSCRQIEEESSTPTTTPDTRALYRRCRR